MNSEGTGRATALRPRCSSLQMSSELVTDRTSSLLHTANQIRELMKWNEDDIYRMTCDSNRFRLAQWFKHVG